MARRLKKRKNDFEYLTFSAVVGASLDILKWFNNEVGCSWNERIFACVVSNAVIQGTLESLEYLKEQNCPWDDGAYELAIRACKSPIKGDNVLVLQWLFDNCSLQAQDRTLYVQKIYEEAITSDTRVWLRDHGFTIKHLQPGMMIRYL